jgi:hypothetical protein
MTGLARGPRLSLVGAGRPISWVIGVSFFISASLAGAQDANDKRPAQAESVELSDSVELARVVSLYEGGKYAECADALEQLLRPDGKRPLEKPEVIENARVYDAACLIGSGKPELADAPLKAAIHQNPQMKPPDSLVFPPQVIDRFLHVRESLFEDIRRAEDEKARALAKLQEDRARAERARVAEISRLAEQQVVVTRKRRWLAAVPFGVGQFQNGNEGLGWLFLTSESLLAASTLATLGVETHLVLAAKAATGGHNAPGTNARLRDWHTALEYTSYSWLGVSLIGIAEAELSFVPERRTVRTRPLPDRLQPPKDGQVRIAPSAALTPGGALFGLGGTF